MFISKVMFIWKSRVFHMCGQIVTETRLKTLSILRCRTRLQPLAQYSAMLSNDLKCSAMLSCKPQKIQKKGKCTQRRTQQNKKRL